MMRTDVVVKAYTERAKNILLRNKAEEEELKKKYGSIFGVLKLRRLPSETQKHIAQRLLTQHAFYDAKEDGFFCHRIIGRTIFNQRDREVAKEKITEELVKDGLELNEFGVLFYDESE